MDISYRTLRIVGKQDDEDDDGALTREFSTDHLALLRRVKADGKAEQAEFRRQDEMVRLQREEADDSAELVRTISQIREAEQTQQWRTQEQRRQEVERQRDAIWAQRQTEQAAGEQLQGFREKCKSEGLTEAEAQTLIDEGCVEQFPRDDLLRLAGIDIDQRRQEKRARDAGHRTASERSLIVAADHQQAEQEREQLLAFIAKEDMAMDLDVEFLAAFGLRAGRCRGALSEDGRARIARKLGSIDELLLLDSPQLAGFGLRIADQELLMSVIEVERAAQPLMFTSYSRSNIETTNSRTEVQGGERSGWGSAVCGWYTMHSGTHVAKFSLTGGLSAIKGLQVGVCLAAWDPNESRTPGRSVWAYRVRDGKCTHDGQTIVTPWSRSAKSRWLARDSITLTLNVGRRTLSVKADDVDLGEMCQGVTGQGGGLRWCASCYSAEDAVAIEYVDFTDDGARPQVQGGGAASRYGMVDVPRLAGAAWHGLEDDGALAHQDSPAYE